MSIQKASGGLDNMLLQVLQQRQQTAETPKPQPIKSEEPKGKDLVTLSGQKPEGQHPLSHKQPKIISEDIQDTENGFRRTQEFENAAGKKFTRIEEITTTPDRSKRVVIQQNESGSTTALENVIDRQDDGSFRLIQRYTDETGETKTNVVPDFNPLDADILLGRPPPPNQTGRNGNDPFQPLRGTQVDLSA